MAKTRLSDCAQLRRTCVETEGGRRAHRQCPVPGPGRRGRSGTVAQHGVRAPVEANEMKPGTRDEGSQALQELERRHHEMGGHITVRGFELEDNLTGRHAA